MNLDVVLEIVNRSLIDSHNPPLNTAEDLILRGIWEYKTYNLVAEEAGYSPGYFTNVVAPELFRRLSEIIGQRVTKKNCRLLLEPYVAAWKIPEETLPSPEPVSLSVTPLPDCSPCFPNGAVALGSPFYIKRSAIEEQVYAEISKPGALVRIKAPQEMGKTSLLWGEVSSRTETHAKELMESVTHVGVYNLDGVEIILIKIWQLQESWN